MDRIFLVTGANRGLGFEFVKQLLHKQYRVIATARNVKESHELLEMVRTNPNLSEFHELDVSSPKSVAHLKDFLSKLSHLDGLINNAGTFGVAGSSLEARAEDYLNTFQVNVLGPLELLRACLPYLEKSKHPVVANITSKMGSIADNTSGEYGPYRVSKAALNMLNKNIAIENPRLISLVLHPGWVQTRMGGKQAPLLPHESVAGMMKVIEEASAKQSGKFFDYSGKEIAW